MINDAEMHVIVKNDTASSVKATGDHRPGKNSFMPVIILAIFIDLVGFGMIVPILPFLTNSYGGDTLTGTTLISVYAFAAFVFGPMWGRVSDRIGRKPALAITFFGAALAYLLLAFSTTLWMVFVARAMSGAMTGNVGIVMAAMADMSDDASRGKALAKIGAAFGLGFAFGPGIGGYLSTVGGETSVFLPGIAACGLSLLAMILTAIYVPETNPGTVSPATDQSDNNIEAPTSSADELKAAGKFPAAHWRSIVFAPNRMSLFTMFVVTAIGQSVSFSIAPFWADSVLGWTAREVGFLLMGTGVFIFVVQIWAVEPLFRIIGEVRSLQLSSVFHIIGCLIIIFGPAHLYTAAIGFPLVLGALTISYPALNSLLSRSTDRRIQGAALGLSNGFSSIGRIAGPIAAALFFSKAVPGAPFVFVAVIGATIFGWSWHESRQRPFQRTPAPPE